MSEFNKTPKRKFVIGIDLGGTNIKSAIIDYKGYIEKQLITSTNANCSQEEILQNILKSAVLLFSNHFDINDIPKNIFDGQIAGIGISAPGYIDRENVIIADGIYNIPSLKGAKIGEYINKHLNIKPKIDNDANNAAKGEVYYGAGKGFKHLICITLGTGIGGGLFLDGKPYGGAVNYAGEIGHNIIVPNGRRCSCGNYGCFETYSSATAIINEANDIIKKELPSKLLNYKNEDINAKLVAELANDGDMYCIDIIYNAGKYIGLAAASCFNLLNVEAFIVGGGVSAAGDMLFNSIEYHARKYALPIAYKSAKILPAKLGNNAGLLGSAAMVFMEENN